MRRFPNLIPILSIVAVAIICGSLVGWWASRRPKDLAESQPIITESESTNELSSSPGEVGKEESPTIGELAPESEPEPEVAKNWDDKLDDILASDKIEEDKKGEMIADMILTQNLPEEAQAELAGHLINLASDDLYEKTAQILTNDATPASVSTIIFDDLYNRDETLSMPIFLKIAKNENHALKDQALEYLQTRITEDYGTNWAQWETAVDKAVKGE